MHDDKFLNKVKPGLYCVATPIGNLGDITLRAINILKNSDVILCEDTRVSKKLLNHLKINKELISYHKFNEQKKIKQILGLLRENKIISIISDAGTPTISDPGKILIRECIKEGLDIYPIPGPSAVSASISISGFSDKYLFLGFLPEKKRDLTNQFKKVSQIGCSIVFFISPNKFDKIKDQLSIFFPDREILICREITKFYEEYQRCSVKNLDKITISKKGEITVVISEAKIEEKKLNQLEESDKKKIKKLLKTKTTKNIVEIINEKKNIKKKIIYDYCLKLKNETN
jgi:16S rRNA (cytidine1402-2'-O)-methyltransferase